MPRTKEPRSIEEQNAIRAARAKLREESELAAIEDRKIEEAIRNGEIEDPDSTDADFIYDEDADQGDDDDTSTSDADDEDGDDEEHESDSDGDGDAPDGSGGEEEGAGSDAGGDQGEGGEDDEPDGMANEWDERSRRQNLAGLSDAELAAEHNKVVGRPPHARAERSTITNNIIKAERPKKG